MNDRSEAITDKMRGHTTEDLLEMWIENDRTSWTDAAFVSIRAVLEARGVVLPDQQRPIGAVANRGGGLNWVWEILVVLGILAVLFENRIASEILGIRPPYGSFLDAYRHGTLSNLIGVIGGGISLSALGIGLRYSTLDNGIATSSWGQRVALTSPFIAIAAFFSVFYLGPTDGPLLMSWFVVFPIYVVLDGVVNYRYFACSTRAGLLPLSQGVAVMARDGFGDPLAVAMIAALVFAFASLIVVKSARAVRLAQRARQNGIWGLWGDRARSSLRVGIIGTGAWMALVILARAYDPLSSEGIIALLSNAFVIFLVLSFLAFVTKAMWHFVRTRHTRSS